MKRRGWPPAPRLAGLPCAKGGPRVGPVRLTEHARETLRRLADQGLRRQLPAARDLATLDPSRDFASNDYLGLARDVTLRQLAPELPWGAAASRLLSGDHPIHHQAEARLAAFVGRPAALLFSSGYAANVSTIPALVGADDLVLSDAANHASLIDGCRLSRARVEILPHGDLDAAERVLRARRARHRLCLLVTDAVFSMDGDDAPLAGLATLAERYEADLYVDEAHGLGVRGPSGRGLCAKLGVVPTVLLGTLGKSFGLAGAFVASEASVRDLLVQRARGFVYSTGIPPALAAAVLRATDRVEGADQERRLLAAHTRRLRTRLEAAGFLLPPVPGPILPLVLGSAESALAAARFLAAWGLHAPAVRPPTVPPGTARLRLVPRADHRPEDIDRLAEALAALPEGPSAGRESSPRLAPSLPR